MRKFIYIFIVAGFFLPFLPLVQANTIKCSSSGYTVATINGVFNNESGAQYNLKSLIYISPDSYNNQKINYQYLLNPTHLGGFGDLAMSVYQKYFEREAVNDYDLVEMINDASQKVTTKKLLLVAHSQGNFYANSFYDTVVGNPPAGGVGIPAESIGVYAVATPAGRVAGGGKWITSDTDKVISGLVSRVPNRYIMPPNTSIKLGAGDSALGHEFADIYLKYRGTEIVSGIESSLDKLKVTQGYDQSKPCIDPPSLTITHRVQGLALAVADPVATIGSNIIVGVVGGTYIVGSTLVNTASAVATTIGSNVAAAVNSLSGSVATLPIENQIAANPILINKIIAVTSNPITPTPAANPAPVFSSASISGPISPLADFSISAPVSATPPVDVVVPIVQPDQIVVTTPSTLPVIAAEDQPDGNGYIAVPLIYEAVPIPDSHPIPSVVGGTAVDISALAEVVATDMPIVEIVQDLINDTSTTTEMATITYQIIDIVIDKSTTTAATSSEETIITIQPPEEPADTAPPVVINELAWGGTPAHSDDEWIELYNKSSQEVNLNGLTLYSKTDGSPYINLTGTIPPRGYFLIEAKNTGETDEATQSSVKNIPADLWTSFGMRMVDTGENIVLSYASTTIDEIPYCYKWCGGATARTTERFDPDSPGSSVSNWSANSAVIYNGLDSAGGVILGTPKARNGANYLINRGANIAADLKLFKSNSPYLVDNITQVIGQGATLAIEPGVVIKFRNAAKLAVDGNIIANGTADDPIVFTAFTDDAYGGDLDHVSVTPARGAWFGVELSNKSLGSSFSHDIFRYGGSYGQGTYTKAMLYAKQVSPPISESIFEYSKAYGLSLDQSNSVVSNNIFRNNSGDNYSVGIYTNYGAPMITGNRFTDNSLGLNTYYSSGTTTDNIFSGNTLAAQIIGPIVGAITGNSGGINDTISLMGNITASGATTTLVANPMPYFLSGTVNVVPGSTLDIKEGTVIKNSMNGSASLLSVYGKLNIDTPSPTGVIFSSNMSTTTKIGWTGIVMNSGATSHISGATIQNSYSGIKYTSSPIYLDNVIFSTNTTAVQTSGVSSVIKASNILFNNNTTNKNPSNLW